MEVIDFVNNNQNSIGIFLHLVKVFDTVNHDTLLHKVENLGIRSYLQGRQHRTKIGTTYSHHNDVNCVVPQGTALGPTLFLFYVNSLAKRIKKGVVICCGDEMRQHQCYAGKVGRKLETKPRLG